jgi:hypothetical protein
LTQFKDLPTKKMEEFDYTSALVESLLSPGLRQSHQAIMCFVGHYLLKEMEKMKEGDKKKYNDLKEALEALDNYNNAMIHLMNKAKVELEPINEDDDDDEDDDDASDDEHSEYQGKDGNQ